jgi:hypothetical protein
MTSFPFPSLRYLRTSWLALLAAGLASACGGDDSAGSTDPNALCDGAKPWPDADASATGLTQCPDGVVHRTSAPLCTPAMAPDLPPTDPAAMQCEGVPCTERPNGFCVATLGSSPDLNTIACVYGCATDEDCGADSACFCGTRGGECIPAGCHAAADCGTDPCILMYSKLECGVPTAPELTCLTATRDCASDKACPTGSLCIDGSCKPSANTCD